MALYIVPSDPRDGTIRTYGATWDAACQYAGSFGVMDVRSSDGFVSDTVGSYFLSGDPKPYACTEQFYYFDTSKVPANTTINSVRLFLYFKYTNSGNLPTYRLVKMDSWFGGGDLSVFQWLEPTDIEALPYINFNHPSSTEYVSFYIDVPVDFINKGGITPLAIVDERMITGVAPTADDRFATPFGDHSYPEWAPRLEIDVTDSVTLRDNRVSNSTFEYGNLEWISGGYIGIGTNPTYAISQDQAYSGTHSLKITGTANCTTSQAQGISVRHVPMVPGETVTASVYARGSTVARNCAIGLYFEDADMNSVQWTSGSQYGGSTTGWSRATFTTTVPAGCDLATVYILLYGIQTNEVHYIDGIMIERSSSPGAYFDGGTTDTSSRIYTFTDETRPTRGNSIEWNLVQASGTGASGYDYGLYHAAGRTPPNVGLGSGAYDFSGGGARGSRLLSGKVAGSYSFDVGSARGVYPARGSSVGSLDWTTELAQGKHHSADGVATGFYIYAGVSTGHAPAPLYRFTPPTYQKEVAQVPLVKRPRYQLTESVSVVRIDGTLQSFKSPDAYMLTRAGTEGTDYFIGGHEYDVTLETALELQAAGFDATRISHG